VCACTLAQDLFGGRARAFGGGHPYLVSLWRRLAALLRMRADVPQCKQEGDDLVVSVCIVMHARVCCRCDLCVRVVESRVASGAHVSARRADVGAHCKHSNTHDSAHDSIRYGITGVADAIAVATLRHADCVARTRTATTVRTV
jgi:hypothetical protein